MLTPEQVAERRNSIGASDVSSILGLNPWKSALQLWLEKTGAVEPENLDDNSAVEWGTILESVIIQHFQQKHPESIVQGFQNHVVHKDYPFITATLDATVTDIDGSTIPLEIKTASAYKAKEWESGVPTYYLAQVQHQMAVTGADKAWVAVLIGGQSYKEYLVQRDEEFIKLIVAKCVEFWRGVTECIPPEADGSESSDRALKTLYPANESGKEIQLDEKIENLLDLKVVYENTRDEYEALCRSLNNKIKEAMKDAEIGKVGKWVVTYKATKTGNRILRVREVAE